MKRFDVNSVREYAKTHTTREISEHFGFADVHSARNFLDENEIQPSRTSFSRAVFIQTVREYTKKHTAKEIQQKFEFSSIGRTFNFCRRHGISFVRMKKQSIRGGMNDLLEWVFDMRACSLCKAMNWENDCAETDISCEEFLCSRLRRFSQNFHSDDGMFSGPQKLLFKECDDDAARAEEVV